ncbi:MAG TPA: hypothetical protein PL084_04110, partial [Chitinophagales bacterium]|nr:hypothetical protein [Chitinophagales bacterium]
ALGGMIFGTIFGVIIVPGLYYIFAKLSEGKKLIRDQEEVPLSEDFVESQEEAALTSTIRKMVNKFLKRNKK